MDSSVNQSISPEMIFCDVQDTHTIHVDEHQRLERAGVTWYLSHLRNDQQSSPHSLQDALNDVSVGSLLRFILTSEDREPKRPHATDGERVLTMRHEMTVCSTSCLCVPFAFGRVLVVQASARRF